MKLKPFLALAPLAFLSPLANAQLVPTTDLGEIGPGTINIVGDTATGANNTDYFNGWNPDLRWGNELVYCFETSNDNFGEITLYSNSGDIDFALVNALDVADDGFGGRVANGNVAFAFVDGALPLTEPLAFGGAEPALLPAGVYYLVAVPFLGAAGNPLVDSTFEIDFTLSNATPPDDVTDLGPLDTLSGLPLAFDASDSVFPPSLALFDETGGLIIGADGPDLEFPNGLEAGIYYLGLSPEGAEWSEGWGFEGSLTAGGEFTLNYDDDGVEMGEVDVSEVAWFSFQVLQGIPVAIALGAVAAEDIAFTIDTNTSGFDTELGIYTQAGERIANDDDGGAGLQSLLSLDAGLDAGTYYIALGQFNTTFGDFDFNVTSTGASGGPWTINYPTGSMSGFLDGGGAIQWFSIEVTAPGEPPSEFIDLGALSAGGGQPITFDATGSAFATSLATFTAGGIVGATGDGTLNIPGGLPPGEYYLALAGQGREFTNGFMTEGGSGSGAWQLSYPTGVESGTVAPDGDQWFRFTIEVAPPPFDIDLGSIAEAKTPFSLDTNGSVIDTEIGVFDAFGALNSANDDNGGGGLWSLLDFPSGLPAGQYYLALGQFNTTYGQTDFTVTTTATAGGDWLLNHPQGTVTGTLAGGGIQWIQFTIGELVVVPPVIVSFGIDLVNFDSVSIEFESSDGAFYTIQGSADGENWANLLTDLPSEGETTEATVNGIAGGGYRLFRVVRQ